MSPKTSTSRNNCCVMAISRVRTDTGRARHPRCRRDPPPPNRMCRLRYVSSPPMWRGSAMMRTRRYACFARLPDLWKRPRTGAASAVLAPGRDVRRCWAAARGGTRHRRGQTGRSKQSCRRRATRSGHTSLGTVLGTCGAFFTRSGQKTEGKRGKATVLLTVASFRREPPPTHAASCSAWRVAERSLTSIGRARARRAR
jgi:hypothetical protein